MGSKTLFLVLFEKKNLIVHFFPAKYQKHWTRKHECEWMIRSLILAVSSFTIRKPSRKCWTVRKTEDIKKFAKATFSKTKQNDQDLSLLKRGQKQKKPSKLQLSRKFLHKQTKNYWKLFWRYEKLTKSLNVLSRIADKLRHFLKKTVFWERKKGISHEFDNF